MHHAWHIAAYALTFPEGLLWPGLRNGWYPLACAAWLPLGLAAMVTAALDW